LSTAAGTVSPASPAGPGGPSSRRAGIALALAAVYLIWGSSYLATKVMVADEPPLFAAGLRFLLAGLLLGAFEWWRSGPPRLSRTELRHTGVVMACTIVISNGCNVLALQHVASNVAALLNATPALWIAWLGTFGRRATPLSGQAKAGLAVGLVGTAMVLSPGPGGSWSTALGWQALILVGCLGWSLGTIYFRNARIENSATMFLALQMLSGGAALVALAAALGEPLAMHWTAESTAAFLWLTLMSSCVAYSAYMYLAVHTTPVVVGTYAYVNPGIAAILGWLVLDERLGAIQLAGMAVILVAVALVTGYLGGARRRVAG
jgi:drug/metabolite transporter (DMT)-like permease